MLKKLWAKRNTNPSKQDIIKCCVYTVLYLAFLCWIGTWWGLIVVPFLIDAYITQLIPWTWWKTVKNKAVYNVMAWVDALTFALVAVYFVNIYFFQNYTIPSSSLEKSLLVGDYLFVSKLSYGPRKPQTPLHMPLCQHTLPFNIGKSYIEWPQWDYERVTPSPVKLNDIVVFNYPAGDTIFTRLELQTEYYRMCYSIGYENYQSAYGRPLPRKGELSAVEERKFYNDVYMLGRELAEQSGQCGQIDWRPVDRRENYVKRCVGLPGQTLEIKDRIIYLDGKENPAGSHVQYNYRVALHNNMPLPDDVVDELGLSSEDLEGLYAGGIIPLEASSVAALSARKDLVDSITLCEERDGMGLYPWNAFYGWTCDNYGPIWIPKKGATIDLTLENLPIYERPIHVYEGHDVQVTDDGQILIDGEVCTKYTFQMDYYWMMGDNRHNSADSRYWGFVPEDHVVGRPLFVWLSVNGDRGGLSHFRWKRMFRAVTSLVK